MVDSNSETIGVAKALLEGTPPEPGRAYAFGDPLLAVQPALQYPGFWLVLNEQGDPLDLIHPDRFRSLRLLATYLEGVDPTETISPADPGEQTADRGFQ